MVVKKEMVREIGQEELLLPDMLSEALMANDQIKYYIALLQSSQQRAENPNFHFEPLREERELALEEDVRFDNVVATTLKKGEEEYIIPLVDEILASIRNCLERMLRPLTSMGVEGNEELKRRADALTDELPVHLEVVPASLIQTIASGNRGRGDTIHLLVIDIHRALNALHASVSTEDIEGAKTYGLGEEDKELVTAFMRGVNRTAPLKFEHPGLGTTVTRSGSRLVIQNDIGETDAHLLIINITGLETSITQTDIHLPRILFFQDLFDQWGVKWQDVLSRRGRTDLLGGGAYHLSRGHFVGIDSDHLKEFLTFLGSRLVFLIDWNRARKRLQVFLPKKDAIAVLRWAAEEEVGHRGFLVLGGDQLIFEALELAPRVPLRYGQPLYQVLGKERTMEFFQWAMHKATTDLLYQKPIRLIRDEIKAELINHFRPAPQEIIGLCIEHAYLIFEVASTLRAAIHSQEQGGERSRLAGEASRSKAWERDADDIVSRIRTLARSIDVAVPFVDLIINADDAIDYLEEAMYLVTLIVPEGNMDLSYAEIGIMADLAAAACQEFIKGLHAAERSYSRGAQDEISEFLHPVHAVIELEEQSDIALRRTLAALMKGPEESKKIVLALDLAKNVEESTNSLMKAAYILKESVFERIGTFEVT